MEAADLPRPGGSPSPRLPRSPRKQNSLEKAATPNSKKKAVSWRAALPSCRRVAAFIQHLACTCLSQSSFSSFRRLQAAVEQAVNCHPSIAPRGLAASCWRGWASRRLRPLRRGTAVAASTRTRAAWTNCRPIYRPPSTPRDDRTIRPSELPRSTCYSRRASPGIPPRGVAPPRLGAPRLVSPLDIRAIPPQGRRAAAHAAAAPRARARSPARLRARPS